MKNCRNVVFAHVEKTADDRNHDAPTTKIISDCVNNLLNVEDNKANSGDWTVLEFLTKILSSDVPGKQMISC